VIVVTAIAVKRSHVVDAVCRAAVAAARSRAASFAKPQ